MTAIRERTAGQGLGSVDVGRFTYYTYKPDGIASLMRKKASGERLAHTAMTESLVKLLKQRGVVIAAPFDASVSVKGYIAPAIVALRKTKVGLVSNMLVRESAVILAFSSREDGTRLVRLPLRIEDTYSVEPGASDTSRPGLEIAAGMIIEELERRAARGGS